MRSSRSTIRSPLASPRTKSADLPDAMAKMKTRTKADDHKVKRMVPNSQFGPGCRCSQGKSGGTPGWFSRVIEILVRTAARRRFPRKGAVRGRAHRQPASSLRLARGERPRPKPQTDTLGAVEGSLGSWTANGSRDGQERSPRQIAMASGLEGIAFQMPVPIHGGRARHPEQTSCRFGSLTAPDLRVGVAFRAANGWGDGQSRIFSRHSRRISGEAIDTT